MQWRVVPGFSDYEINRHGDVRRLTPGHGARPGRPVKRTISRAGYWQVTLKNRKLFVHRLVCLAFVGPPPSPRHEVNHIDRDRLNTYVGNLEWVTRGENMIHSYANGLVPLRGEQKTGHKLTEQDVREIRSSPDGARELGRRYGVHHMTVINIRRRVKWRHV